MSDSTAAALIGGLCAVIAALLGPRLIARQARRAESRQADVDRDRLGVESWQAFAREQKDRADEQEQRSDRLQERIDNIERTAADLRRRVDQLEAEVRSQRVWRRLATDYIRHLIEALSRADVQVPSPPDGLDLTSH